MSTIPQQMGQPKLSRKEKLELWRKGTGRTPMKRLSYVQKCWEVPAKPTSSCTPHATSRALHRPAPTCTIPHAVNPSVQGAENAPSTSSRTHSLSRKEMLEQWQSVHGSTVKKPRSTLKTTNKLASSAQPSARTRRHTISAQCRNRSTEAGKQRRQALRELFQQDINNTAAEITAEYYNHHISGASNAPSECSVTPRAASPGGDGLVDGSGAEGREGTSHCEGTRHTKKRQSYLQCDEGLVFKSTTVRYSMALSEPKYRQRRHTLSGVEEPCLFLTPVRRSTRPHHCGPGLDLDRTLCFDSPTQASSSQEVQVVPNKALIFNQ